MGRPVRVLMIDDSVDDVLLTHRALRRAGFDATMTHVQDVDGLMVALDRPHDVVLCDSRGLSFSPKPFLAARSVPFVAFSGTDSPESREGATAFVSKDSMDVDLVRAVEGLVGAPSVPLVDPVPSIDSSTFIGSMAGAVTSLSSAGDDLHRLVVGGLAGCLSILAAKAVTYGLERLFRRR